jgi:hypothetical protein
LKVLLKVPLNPYSGYGQDGCDMALTFRQAGADVYLDPAFVQAPLPLDVAELLTKRLEAPFDMLIQHMDPSNLGITPEARRSASVTVAHTMWEMSTLDNCVGRSSLKKRLKDFDLVVGYDGNTTQALDKYVSTNAATVQGGYMPRKWPQAYRNWDSETFNFCMVGALGPRKDPFVAIDAFRELREEHPELNIALNVKTNEPGLHSKMSEWIPGLQIFYEVWPENTLRDFYRQNHVLIAPSRGEGKNLPALEMMSTGGTVIATNWGGHTGWLSNQYAYPLDFKLEPLNSSRPDCRWAKASKEHLKQLMLHCYHHREEVARKGDLAANLIPAMCSWEKVVDRLMDRVGEVNERGERVLHKYRVAKARVDESKVVLL